MRLQDTMPTKGVILELIKLTIILLLAVKYG